jgi:hypothetical protein
MEDFVLLTDGNAVLSSLRIRVEQPGSLTTRIPDSAFSAFISRGGRGQRPQSTGEDRGSMEAKGLEAVALMPASAGWRVHTKHLGLDSVGCLTGSGPNFFCFKTETLRFGELGPGRLSYCMGMV